MGKITTTHCQTPKDLVDKHPELLLECLNYYHYSHPELDPIIDIIGNGEATFSALQLSLVKTAAYNYALTCKHKRATYLHVAVIFDPDAKSFLNSEV